MKKIYIRPVTEATSANLASLIMTSFPDADAKTNISELGNERQDENGYTPYSPWED